MIRFLFSGVVALGATTAFAGVPRVVTDIAPVQSLAARVMAGIGEADVLLPPGASPHDHSLRPSEARSLSDADLVIWVGPALTGWLEDPIQTLAPEAASLILSEADGLSTMAIREGGAFGGHDLDDHDNDEEGFDPHMWLDPKNALVWLDAIAITLASIDPENAAAYAANAAAGTEEITVEASRIAALMGGVPRSYLAYHDAFQYAENWLGLTGVGAIQSGHASEPGPARLAGLRDEVAEQGVACVLAEPQYNEGLLKAVMGDDQDQVVVIDPLGGAFEAGPSLYFAILGQFSQIPEICD